MARKTKKASRQNRLKSWRWPAYLIIFGLLAYAVVTQLGHFRRGVSALATANLALALVGLVLTAGTFFLAAAAYWILAMHPLRYWRTLAVELAAALVTRLLPAGIGGLGLHGDYLFRQKHTAAEATAVVSVNNALGIIGNIALLVLALALWPHSLKLARLHISGVTLLAVIGGLALLLVIIFSVARIRRALASFASNFSRSLKTYFRHLHKLVLALALAMSITLVYALVLSSSASAVGIHLAFGPIFVIFSVGTLVGAATPTPGGLVGVEAGLFAGFTAYGALAAPALAAVLLFRLLTYWLPLFPGALALVLVRRAKYI